jgi:hypothetical protein
MYGVGCYWRKSLETVPTKVYWNQMTTRMTPEQKDSSLGTITTFCSISDCYSNTSYLMVVENNLKRSIVYLLGYSHIAGKKAFCRFLKGKMTY